MAGAGGISGTGGGFRKLGMSGSSVLVIFWINPPTDGTDKAGGVGGADGADVGVTPDGTDEGGVDSTEGEGMVP